MEASMPSDALDTSKWSRRAGIAMTALFVLFMVFDTSIKLVGLRIVDDTLGQLGYPAGLGFPIGVLELVLLVLYLIPRTAFLGAILTTAYLGGAVWTHLRVGEPWFFPIIVAVLMWLGLALRRPAIFRLNEHVDRLIASAHIIGMGMPYSRDELVRACIETVRKNVTIDWTVKESVRAKLRVIVKRIIRKYGYPPDKQEKATQTVLEQAEVLCSEVL